MARAGAGTPTASARIVAALRERIVSGELAAGDRVPSTREIARRWGVAMATATKVLTALQAEGLVRPVPGVGTVVGPEPHGAATAPLRGPATSAADRDGSAALTAERVVRCGIAIADAEGLSAVSMRRVGTELGVATMSLYRHVADKDDLVTRMADTAFGELAPPLPPGAGWRARLEAAAHELWSAFRRHPWLAPAVSFTRPQPMPSAMSYSDRVLDALSELDLEPAVAFDTHLILFNHVRGSATPLEPERDAEADTGLTGDEWMDAQHPRLRAALAMRDSPALTRTLDALEANGYDQDLDALFATGLTWLLDGLERRLAN